MLKQDRLGYFYRSTDHESCEIIAWKDGGLTIILDDVTHNRYASWDLYGDDLSELGVLIKRLEGLQEAD